MVSRTLSLRALSVGQEWYNMCKHRLDVMGDVHDSERIEIQQHLNKGERNE